MNTMYNLKQLKSERERNNNKPIDKLNATATLQLETSFYPTSTYKANNYNPQYTAPSKFESFSAVEPVVRMSNPKSAAIDIAPTKAGWREEKQMGLRNKNLGKVAINKHTKLSTSTDELLKLASGRHMRKRDEYGESPGDELSFGSRPETPSIDSSYDISENPSQVEVNIDDFEADFDNLSISQPLATEDDLDMNESAADSVCRYFASGFCSRGNRCNFVHNDETTTTPPPPPPIASIVPPPTKSTQKNRIKTGSRHPVPASCYVNLTLEECRGNIATMCLDQHGCRFLQRHLDSGDSSVVTLIYSEVIEHIMELMSDPFGNYLCQKLIEFCNEEQRLEITKRVSGNLVLISKNMHGTRAAQKLIECISSPEETRLVRKSLKGSVVSLIQDLNGNHVIQKCLHKMEPNDNQFIYDAVAQHCIQVSTHRHGCCVMQRCIDHATYDQKLQLVEEIKNNALSLVQDPYGNYVVQYAIDLDIPTLPTDIIIKLQGNLHYLAKQKFSSNVIEKCLKTGDSACVIRVLKEFLGDFNTTVDGKVQDQIIGLLQDSYGNYVIQTCLSEGASKAHKEYSRLCETLRPFIHQLHNAPYMKRIATLLNLVPVVAPVNNNIMLPTAAGAPSLVQMKPLLPNGIQQPSTLLNVTQPTPVKSKNNAGTQTLVAHPKYRR
eukprot:TRINITY_DN6055_c0_g1_i2.p1 TRINITY_DN6055_c0_g1~~TRINITY_DN6055_c0_g1_i2.p1  ORF type:complete len:665 (+),score=81.08 TRINITY_DN6055_c0_g1_i2:83-2077(+)